MLTELRLKEDFILDTIENIMSDYDLVGLNNPANKDLCKDIKAGIYNMSDFKQLLQQCEIAPQDVKKCTLLAEGYLHMKTSGW